MAHKVLIVTGGLIDGKEDSLLRAARKWWGQFRHARNVWLDVKVKLVMAEPLARLALARPLLRLRPRPEQEAVAALAGPDQSAVPSLTELVLMTLLAQEGMPYEAMTLDTLFAEPEKAERLIEESDCIFLSTTYLHDFSELEPLIRRLKRPHNHLVLGGALAGIVHERWPGQPEVEVLAIGYGELLVGSLVAWIRSNFTHLAPPPGGRLARRQGTTFLYSGVPASLDLDILPRPDWRLAQAYYGRPLPVIYYESVRGCPYRCNFCNYPYLFDDTKFRYRSARQMADDWEHYVTALGVEYILCLDSLFTMPRQRLQAFCRQLIERKLPVKWVCYARADDLTDEETVALMKAAGAHQVQIGIESGDPVLLHNMNKACTVEANHQALRHCRSYGLTSIASFIVGYPGETAESLARTYDFIAASPPDFYFLATFSTRIPGVPLLRPALRQRFGLEVMDNLYSMAPYWRHDTMACTEAGNHVRALDRKLMEQRLSLNATLFYAGMLAYRPEFRQPLLDFQHHLATRPGLTGLFGLLNRLVDRQMRRDVARHFGRRSSASL